MFALKDSVRWLLKARRREEAWESLKWVRGSDSTEVRKEMDEITAGIALELKETEGFTYKGTPPALHTQH